MDIELSAFHFLRPFWLLLLFPGVLFPLLWRRRHDLVRHLDGIIAPHLLRSLVVAPADSRRLRPVYLLGVLLALGAVAAAGPSWQQDRPDFLDNRAPLILALDLSPSMDANDVPPTRLIAAQHKLRDLVRRRAGTRTALIAYAGSAHLVLPATDDPGLLDGFLQALSSALIKPGGKDVLGVVGLARHLIDAEGEPGTLVLFTDGADPGQFERIGEALRGSRLQVLVVAVGSKEGGMLRNADGQNQALDGKGLEGLARAADAPLGSLTLNDDDLDWIELHAQRHFQATRGAEQQLLWKDAGYWLCWPLALLALLGMRKGWRVNWLSGWLLFLSLGWPVAPVSAGPLADAFLTADQQGRWAFEHGRYPQAAALFSDPYWKGIAAYHAADYAVALDSFARVDTAQADFYLGNTYVRLSRFAQAIGAYRRALHRQREFPEARANLALAEALQKDHDAQQEAGAPAKQPDNVVLDKPPGAGKTVTLTVERGGSDEQWLNNLGTSPAQFLQRKFLLQDSARRSPAGGAP